ncbi:hypothetical protein IGJ83_002597 [Enterococcus pernyi]
MTKHNYYPKELKIQMVKRLLTGEPPHCTSNRVSYP